MTTPDDFSRHRPEPEHPVELMKPPRGARVWFVLLGLIGVVGAIMVFIAVRVLN